MRKALLLCVLVLWSGGLQAAETHDADKKAGRRLEVRVTPEMIRHSRIYDVLYFVDFIYVTGALLLILGAGWSARFRDAAQRTTKKKFLAAMLYFVLLSLALTVMQLPLAFYGGF